jgi:hypothetical protein
MEEMIGNGGNDDTKLFHSTDLKITDRLPQSQKFEKKIHYEKLMN